MAHPPRTRPPIGGCDEQTRRQCQSGAFVRGGHSRQHPFYDAGFE